ncbi:MAG: hypothetical protein J0L53_07380 [Spirochaetes bacterium]|nr:hypothetical protein [Spirochaetota bacterium]MBX3721860.1 hypothetical protein [Turneriella sp.]
MLYFLDWRRMRLMIFAVTALSYCTTGQTRVSNGVPNTKAEVGGVEAIYATPITQADKPRFYDCAEYSPATYGWRSETPQFDVFNEKLNDKRRFYLTEEGGYPFVIGYHNLDRVKPGITWMVGLRGESSGFHKSSVTKGILKMMEDLPNAAMITIDEYKYKYQKNPPATNRPLHPICHRTYYPEGKIHTEIPAFRNGGGIRLLKRALPAPYPIIIMSYSNSTTPRGELLSRTLLTDEKLDYKHFGDPKQFLANYIAKTAFNDAVYGGIKGFIDIEGNYEYNKSLWDLLAYIKLEIEGNPNKFYYSAMRIEKFDAYPVQTTMIRALDLKGVEDEHGIIRFTNPAGNVVIDMVTNHFQPYYSGVGGDVRKNTNMTTYPGTVKRTRSDHYMLGPFIHKRLLETTPFLKKESQVPAATAGAS